SISVSEETLWQKYAEANNSATIEVVRLTPAEVAATFKPLTDEEISAFEASNGADIEKYYNEHLGDYTTPAKAKLQQVTIQKSITNVKNPGEKTVKSYLAGERFAIARAKIVDEKLDFDQAFVDYDESDNKELKGVTGLLNVDIMAGEIQAAIDGKNVGDIVTAEMSDRYVIAKVVERADKVVTPLNEVRHDIARKVMDDKRVKDRIAEASSNILELAKGGQPLSDALNASLYANILAEQPVALEPAPAEPADGAAADAPAPEPVAVPVPTDLLVIADSARIQVKTLSDVATNSGFIMGLGINDDLARDIRSASENTVLPKTYEIGPDVVVARVVSKKGADRAAFNEILAERRDKAVDEKILQLIGNPEEIIGMNGSYGLWLDQKLNAAIASKKMTINNDYFAREQQRRDNAARERAEQKAEQN
ncbi:MAG: peptidyl-prolyl cis-trans isomerase, partial [Proteobacteria bacterium]|nr:peptidyl-prolyl cis-trans isomerase [Pseudomonadota bacterium]